MALGSFFQFCAISAIIAGASITVGKVHNDIIKTSKGTIFNFPGALIDPNLPVDELNLLGKTPPCATSSSPH